MKSNPVTRALVKFSNKLVNCICMIVLSPQTAVVNAMLRLNPRPNDGYA